jgi:hypothetical protein
MPMTFSKDDMCFIHYRWEKDERPAGEVFCGEPSRRIFDPFNGDQVLFLINFYGSVVKSFGLKDAHALERKIAHQLPLERKSERSVYNWIVESMNVMDGNMA